MVRGVGAVMAATMLVGGPLAAQDRSPLSPHDRTQFAWLDRVAELPRLSAAEFVKITYTQVDSEPAQTWREFGFITATQGEHLEILTLDLRLNRPLARVVGTVESVVVERQDLQQTAAMAIGLVAPGDVRTAADVMLGPLELFVLARACSEAGWDQLAADLLTTARQASQENLRADLRYDIASLLTMRAFRLLESDGPREEVRRLLRKIVDEVPEFDGIESARSAIRALNETIALERRRRPANPATLNDRIAGLISALIDQKATWQISPGAVYFFAVEPEDTPSGPARDLWKLGHVAVPHLIEALDDRRLTRAVYWRNARGWPITVGEAAAQVLGQIAGQRFAFDDSVDHRVRTWWNTVKK